MTMPATSPLDGIPPAAQAAPKPNLENRFVQRAILYNQAVDDQAQRLAAATSQPPANAQDMSGDPAKLAAAWNFSPSQNPAADFWQLHDQTLAQNMAQVQPDSPPEMITAAHNNAETTALNAIFPYRGELMGVGTRPLGDQVSQAERISKIVDNHVAGLVDTNGSPQEAGPAPVEAAPIAAPATPDAMPQIAPTGGPV